MPDPLAHDPDRAPSPARESLAVFATVVRSPALVRALVAYLLFQCAEYATWIAMLVYAFDRGGTTAVGVVAFAQLAPAVVFAPVAASLGDRVPRLRMLAVAHGAFALVTLLTAGFLFGGLQPLVVYAGAIACGLALTLVRPAHAAVLPLLARLPSELTAANVATGTADSLGVLLGSVGGGLVLATYGPAVVFLVAGILLAVGAVAVTGARPPTGRGARARTTDRTASEGTELAERITGEGPSPTGGARSPARRVLAEAAGGIRIIRADPHIGVVVTVLALSSVLVGMLDVLGVVLALDVLDAGEAAVGLISGAIGAGGLLGAGLTIGLVGRQRLLGALLVGAVVAGAGIAASGFLPLLVVALAGFLAGGVGKSVFDVAGRTMLQRVAPETALTRIFGLLEGVSMAALAAGSVAAPVLVALVGPTGALVVAGALVPAASLALRPALGHADAAGVVHERELAVLRAVPMFAPLRVTTLERLAMELEHVHAGDGTDVIREGDPGDRFYVLAAGRCDVLVRGRVVNALGPGDAFGEIALLADVPRTATVRAIGDVDVYALEREPFLEAVTGQPRSRAAAQRQVDEHLGRAR